MPVTFLTVSPSPEPVPDTVPATFLTTVVTVPPVVGPDGVVVVGGLGVEAGGPWVVRRGGCVGPVVGVPVRGVVLVPPMVEGPVCDPLR